MRTPCQCWAKEQTFLYVAGPLVWVSNLEWLRFLRVVVNAAAVVATGDEIYDEDAGNGVVADLNVVESVAPVFSLPPQLQRQSCWPTLATTLETTALLSSWEPVLPQWEPLV